MLNSATAACRNYLILPAEWYQIIINTYTSSPAGQVRHFVMERRDVVGHLSELGDELLASNGAAPAEVVSNHLGP